MYRAMKQRNKREREKERKVVACETIDVYCFPRAHAVDITYNKLSSYSPIERSYNTLYFPSPLLCTRSSDFHVQENRYLAISLSLSLSFFYSSILTTGSTNIPTMLVLTKLYYRQRCPEKLIFLCKSCSILDNKLSQSERYVCFCHETHDAQKVS